MKPQAVTTATIRCIPTIFTGTTYLQAGEQQYNHKLLKRSTSNNLTAKAERENGLYFAFPGISSSRVIYSKTREYRRDFTTTGGNPDESLPEPDKSLARMDTFKGCAHHPH